MVIFEESGHYPFLEEPENFSRELGEFWNQEQVNLQSLAEHAKP